MKPGSDDVALEFRRVCVRGAVAQDAASHEVLTLAWMNRDAGRAPPRREAHYWSRSRDKLWRRARSSGFVQRVREIRPDCDGDAILLAGRARSAASRAIPATSGASS